VLVVLLLFMQVAYPYKGWVMLLVALGGVWLIGYVWARLLADNLGFQREIRFGWAHVGDRLEERFTLTNSGPIHALWIEIEDHTTMPGYNAGRVTAVGSSSQNRWYTHGVCTQRGIFTLGPTALHTSDPFGLYAVTIYKSNATTLTVTPPIVPLPTIEVAPGGRVGEGRSRTTPFERTVSSTGVREYVPGDGLNWVHWPTSARKGELFVRLFDSTPSGDWWIFLDLDAQAQFGTAYNSTEEHGIILAASLADKGLRMGRSVGLVSNAENLIYLPPDSSDSQRQKILRALALAKPGPHSLSQLLTYSTTRKMNSLILITPSQNPHWIEALLPLCQKGAVPTVLLLDPVSFDQTQSAGNLPDMLNNLSLVNYTISKDLLDQPEARPGHRGEWDWQVSPSGRAKAVHSSGDLRWRTLG